MSDDDFDEEDIDGDLDDDLLSEDLDDDLDEALDDEIDDDLETDILEGDEEAEPSPVVAALVEGEAEPAADDEEDDVLDLQEELHPDDVEEALDVVLREKTAASGLEDEEEDEEEVDERGETGTKIVPRRDNEFLCKSCFLVLPRHQLADEERMICRDCA